MWGLLTSGLSFGVCVGVGFAGPSVVESVLYQGSQEDVDTGVCAVRVRPGSDRCSGSADPDPGGQGNTRHSVRDVGEM